MKLRFESVISAPREEIFSFHTVPTCLAVLMRDWPGFRLLHHDGNVLQGSTTWFEQNVCRCIPVVMGFRHTVYQPPKRFGEEVIHGPFSRFTHVHEFEKQGGGTLVRDELDVTLPSIYGGETAMHHVVAPKIRRVFEYRHLRLSQLAEDGTLARGTALSL